MKFEATTRLGYSDLFNSFDFGLNCQGKLNEKQRQVNLDLYNYMFSLCPRLVPSFPILFYYVCMNLC